MTVLAPLPRSTFTPVTAWKSSGSPVRKRRKFPCLNSGCKGFAEVKGKCRVCYNREARGDRNAMGHKQTISGKHDIKINQLKHELNRASQAYGCACGLTARKHWRAQIDTLQAAIDEEQSNAKTA